MTEPASIGTVEMEDVEEQQSTRKGQQEEKTAEGKPASTDEKEAAATEEATARYTKPVHADYKTADAFFALLARQKADHFAIGGEPSTQPIWICSKNDKVNDVLNGMIKRNILSVPVLLPSGKYYGFIDLMDVVRYCVHHFGASTFQGEERSFFDMLNEEKKFLEKTVNDLMESPLQLRNPYNPIESGYSAWAVVEALARKKALYRVPVINEKRQIVNLVTQSQIIRFLDSHLKMLGGLGKKKIELCTRLFKPVLSVSEDSIAIDAFNLMVQHEIQGIAIVSESGRLRGNLSLRDLKIVGPDLSLFWRLHQTVKNFVIKLRHEFSERHKRPRQVVYVTPNSTFEEVIHALCKHAVHRLYICDNHQNKHPVGVITLTDVLLEIIDS